MRNLSFQLEAQLGERGVTIELTPAANKWIAERGYDEQMGARPLGRVIQEHIKKPLADEVLFGKLQNGGTVKVDVKNGADELVLKFVPPAPARPKAIAAPAKRKAITKSTRTKKPAAKKEHLTRAYVKKEAG